MFLRPRWGRKTIVLFGPKKKSLSVLLVSHFPSIYGAPRYPKRKLKRKDSTCKIRIRYGLVSFSHVPLRERAHSLVAGACWRVPFRRHVSPPWPTLCQSVIHFFLRGTSAALFFGVCLSLLAFLREVGPPTLFELFELQFLKTRCTVVYRLPLAAGISYFERDQDI